MPQNAGLSVGYLWGRVRDADLWDFCGARGRLKRLSQLGPPAPVSTFSRHASPAWIPVCDLLSCRKTLKGVSDSPAFTPLVLATLGPL